MSLTRAIDTRSSLLSFLSFEREKQRKKKEKIEEESEKKKKKMSRRAREIENKDAVATTKCS